MQTFPEQPAKQTLRSFASKMNCPEIRSRQSLRSAWEHLHEMFNHLNRLVQAIGKLESVNVSTKVMKELPSSKQSVLPLLERQVMQLLDVVDSHGTTMQDSIAAIDGMLRGQSEASDFRKELSQLFLELDRLKRLKAGILEYYRQAVSV